MAPAAESADVVVVGTVVSAVSPAEAESNAESKADGKEEQAEEAAPLRVIFLDIDGVLAVERSIIWWVGGQPCPVIGRLPAESRVWFAHPATA